MQFQLIGCTAKFRVVACHNAAGFIPSVVGHTLDGTRQTVARVADVEFENELDREEILAHLKKIAA